MTMSMANVLKNKRFLSTAIRARPSAPAFANAGKLAKPTYTETTFTACIQQADQEDLIDVCPEGERHDGWILVLSTTAILMSNIVDTSCDLVKWNGGVYRVVKGGKWSQYGYFESYAKEYHAGVPT